MEINLVAIAKLRTSLRVLGVAVDCVVDLKYGWFRAGDEFVEDEEGNDTIVDYGSCSGHVIDKVWDAFFAGALFKGCVID
jgi:hypothetical protein